MKHIEKYWKVLKHIETNRQILKTIEKHQNNWKCLQNMKDIQIWIDSLNTWVEHCKDSDKDNSKHGFSFKEIKSMAETRSVINSIGEGYESCFVNCCVKRVIGNKTYLFFTFLFGSRRFP